MEDILIEEGLVIKIFKGSSQFSRGRGRFGQNKPQCQLCLRFDYTVLNCYYRFDQSFQGSFSEFHH